MKYPTSHISVWDLLLLQIGNSTEKNNLPKRMEQKSEKNISLQDAIGTVTMAGLLCYVICRNLTSSSDWPPLNVCQKSHLAIRSLRCVILKIPNASEWKISVLLMRENEPNKGEKEH